MVFFISIIIVAILYYLQADGLIYVTIIALIGELANILMMHTMAKSVEKRAKIRTRQLVDRFHKKIKVLKKNIQELEKVRDEAGTRLFEANKKIKEYQELLEETDPEATSLDETPAPQTDTEEAEPADAKEPEKQDQAPQDSHSHLPAGSNRKDLPI